MIFCYSYTPFLVLLCYSYTPFLVHLCYSYTPRLVLLCENENTSNNLFQTRLFACLFLSYVFHCTILYFITIFTLLFHCLMYFTNCCFYLTFVLHLFYIPLTYILHLPYLYLIYLMYSARVWIIQHTLSKVYNLVKLSEVLQFYLAVSWLFCLKIMFSKFDRSE